MPDNDEIAPGLSKEDYTNMGHRADGSRKGLGFLGVLPRPDGTYSTELSIGTEIDGKEMEIPSLVPTLTQQEIDHLLDGGKPTPEIIQKAADHAIMRLKEGKSVFAEPDLSKKDLTKLLRLTSPSMRDPNPNL